MSKNGINSIDNLDRILPEEEELNKNQADNADRTPSLEEAFAQLDEYISELEKPDNSLEASFRAYEKGMKLVKYCNDAIDKVEKKVLVLGQDGELDEF